VEFYSSDKALSDKHIKPTSFPSETLLIKSSTQVSNPTSIPELEFIHPVTKLSTLLPVTLHHQTRLSTTTEIPVLVSSLATTIKSNYPSYRTTTQPHVISSVTSPAAIERTSVFPYYYPFIPVSTQESFSEGIKINHYLLFYTRIKNQIRTIIGETSTVGFEFQESADFSVKLEQPMMSFSATTDYLKIEGIYLTHV